jgi:isopenicillin N synthase-like dioxygenase
MVATLFVNSSAFMKKPNDAVIRRRPIVSRRRRDGLLKYARNATSQNGEDGIIERLFQLLPTSSSLDERVCVDIGAWDGVHLSNTHSLLVNPTNKMTKWKGLLIEQDETRFQQLRQLHEPLGNICLGVAVSCTEGSPNGLHQLLKVHAPNFPNDFDFISIDVDGSDYWLLHDLWKSGFQPKVVCVEFNPTMPDDLIYIPPRRDDLRYGASLSALVELAEVNGYRLVETTLYNAFFVDNKLYDDFLAEEVPDTTIEALHEVTMGTCLFQLYDGTVKLWGCKKLLWHRIPMDDDKMQIIPAEQRQFPFAPSTLEQDSSISHQAVDMSSYCMRRDQSSDDDMKGCAKRLWKQLNTDGFALVCGTGLSNESCQAALKATKAFMQEEDESVRRSCLTKDRARRGYSPMGTENFASLIGEHGPNDLVRKFRIGLPSIGNEGDDKGVNSPLLRPNVWPTTEDWNKADEFRKSIEAYYDAVHQGAHAIVRAICDGAFHEQGLTLNFLSSSESVAHTSILTLLGYQTTSRKKGKQARPLVAAHTDVGVITLLLFDEGDCATLQRRAADVDSWTDVLLPRSVPGDPVFVVNVGDCLSDLTSGTLPSTLHRVMPRPHGATPRNCLALFVGLDPRETLTLPSTGEVISYEEWRKRRIARAQDVLRARDSSIIGK